MYIFWYRFVRPNISSISRGVGEQIYSSVVIRQLSDFMGEVFEEICQQYLFLPDIYETLPFPVGKVGHWWGNNSKKKCQEEIDLMSVYEDKILIGECKWKNEKVGMSVIEKLLERGALFSHKEKNYIIFSKSGFSGEVIEYAKVNDNIRLVDFEKMCKGDNT